MTEEKPKRSNKPVIETIINTSALAVAAAGTNMLLMKDVWGWGLLATAMGMEYFKYWGRNKELW